ncbi:MAG: 1-acyl-sn-glycerol-3-phosphate acyltransferase [Firmicutes bacterium]|nr:1-acyl-sn-glycerol-3-phosphate acyltransferase [Bacillota bacterium]
MRQFFKRKYQILKQPLPDLSFLQRCFLRFFLFCFEDLIQVENLNMDDINLEEPVIFALNHNNSFETVLVPTFLIFHRRGRKIHFISDWLYGHLPITGWIFKQMDPIYVYHKPSTLPFLNRLRPGVKPKPAYQQCVERLQRGDSIGIFPEGTRNRNPQYLLKGQIGIGYIALGSQAPVLPIGIDFPSRTALGRIPKLGRIILRVGPKMRFAQEYEIFHAINQTPLLPPKERRKLQDRLAGEFLALDVVDESQPNLDAMDTAAFPELSVAARFVGAVRAEMTRATSEGARRRVGAALRLGLSLLEGRRPR